MKKIAFFLFILPFAAGAGYNCTVTYTSCYAQQVKNLPLPNDTSKVCKRSCTPTPASRCAPDSCTPNGNDCKTWKSILNKCKQKPANEVLDCIVSDVSW